MRNNRTRFFAAWITVCLLAAASLTACGSDKSFYITKQWGEWQIKLETRPHPIVKGHNEFLLHVDGSQRRLPQGMIILYSLSPKGPWIQAMPDGLSDIFRRALTVPDPAHAKLYARLNYHGKQTELVFDLSEQGS